MHPPASQAKSICPRCKKNTTSINNLLCTKCKKEVSVPITKLKLRDQKDSLHSKNRLTAFNLKNHKYAQTIHIRLKNHNIELTPQFLHEDFQGDIDALGNFLDNLHDDECGIIAQHGNDLKRLRYIKEKADHDTANTSKYLAMEG